MDPVDVEYVYLQRQIRLIRDRENPLEQYPEEVFQHRFRLSKDSFRDLLNELQIDRLTQRNDPLPPALQLSVTLQFFATGMYQYALGDLQGISQSSVCRVIRQVSASIAALARTYVRVPHGQERLQINRKFREVLRIPSIIGAIDCSHIRIKAPSEHAAAFVNRKGYYSINAQMVATPDYKFVNVVARHPGSAHDSRIYTNSSIKERLETGDLQGCLLIGDQGYACSSTLITPVRFPNTDAEQAYNFHFIRARGCVERAFGVLKSRFAVLGPDSRIRLQYETASTVIVACTVLHNICNERRIAVQEFIPNANDLNVFNQGNPPRNLERNALRTLLIRRFFER